MILDILPNNKSISEVINNDLYFRGYEFIRKEYRRLSIVKTLNNEFTIKFDREPCKLLNFGESPYYLCYMTFINNIGIEVLKLSFSENDALQILDCFSQFEDFNMPDIAFNLCVGDMKIYTMFIVRYDDLYDCTIRQGGIDNKPIDILKFKLPNNENDNGITDIMYSMYFSYLIDIDCCSSEYDISLLESVYDKFL